MKMWIGALVFALFAIPITLMDLREYRIPDLLSIGGICVMALLDVFVVRQSLLTLALEVVVGFGVFWLIRVVTHGKLGLGDAKYSAFIALCVGMPGWLAAIAAASVIGLVCGLVLLGRGRVTRTTRIPFAPFLSLGAALSIVAARFVPGM
jgi:prepilin signal peptidase PulO-like enzyme (type II secretory pathway)